MNKYGKKSSAVLATCHPYWKLILEDVLIFQDHSLISGYRSQALQFSLYQKGRKLITKLKGKIKKWIVKNKKKVVTNCDGTIKTSDHNFLPSDAIDIIPYPEGNKSKSAFLSLSRLIKLSAHKLGITVEWGGDWKTFKDPPHWVIRHKEKI